MCHQNQAGDRRAKQEECLPPGIRAGFLEEEAEA